MSRNSASFALLLPATVLGFLFIGSLVYMSFESFVVGSTFGFGNYKEFFERPDYIEKGVRTIVISLWTTLASFLIGYPTALFLSRVRRARNFFLVLIIMPWLVSVVVRTYGWIILLGNRGVVNESLMWLGIVDSPIKLIYNTFGVVVGLTHVFCPFMIISIVSVLSHLDESLTEASMIQGAGPVKTFLNITWPLSMPGVLSGCAIVFLLSSGAIVTPLMLGGFRDTMIGTQIYQDVFSLFNFPKAAAMAFVLTVVSLAFVLPMQWIERRVLRNTMVERREG
jgi:putative spermidine/putrescine transport system permease protein